MLTPKQARPPTRQKQMLKHARPKQLSPLEAAQLRNLGKKDGLRSLPRRDESGAWLSPLLRREADALSEFCAFAWGSLHHELESDHREIKRVEEQLNIRRKNAPPLNLSLRFRGEEHLAEATIRNRRQREYERRNSSYLSEIGRLESALDGWYQKLAKHQTTVLAAEQMTRMVCKRVHSHTQQRCDAYFEGALQTHPQSDILPPAPDLLPDSDAAEELYLSQHETTAIAAGKMLEHNNRVANRKRNRMEEFYDPQ